MAVLLLLTSNRQRCTSALEQCPAAGPLLTRVAAALQRLSIFSGAARGGGV